MSHTPALPSNEITALPPLRSRKNGHNASEQDMTMEQNSAPNKNHAEFFDLTPGMVVVMDTDHTIIDLNREAARVLGRTRQECAGHKLWEYLDNPDCRANKCAAARAVATGKKQEGIVRTHGGADEGAMLVSAAPRFGR